MTSLSPQDQIQEQIEHHEAEHPDLVTIDVDNIEVPQVADCTTENGWGWTNAPMLSIILGT